MPLLTMPCPQGQTITLTREGALDSLAMCAQCGELEVQWTM